ncbi:MAG: N-acetylmuramoyl-L-alanine amidase family protein [Bacteroidota bacterium]
MARVALVRRGDPSRWFLALLTFGVLWGLARTASIQVSTRLSGAVSGRRVVVDPGHGGQDPGAIGRSGLREKDLVLDISLHLRRFLGRAGVYVTMTRVSDRDFGAYEGRYLSGWKRRDLIYRVNLANRTRADVFLSIHANSIPDARWAGAQVFYNPARPLARDLAASIQQAFAAHLGPNYRLIKPGDYRVLNDTTMPAAVVEVGFLSNPAEEARLADPVYRGRIAEAVFQGLVHYFLLLAERGERTVPTMTIPVAAAGAGDIEFAGDTR